MRIRNRMARVTAASLGVVTVAGCSKGPGKEVSTRADSTKAPPAPTVATGTMPETWSPPAVDSTPDDPYEVAVYRGLALLTHTRDSLPKFVGGNLNCTSCHLDEGRRESSAPFNGVYARYPKYIERAGAVASIEDRVNYCMTRSLAGSRLPADSREMQDMVAYLAFLSRGVPIGAQPKNTGLPKMPALSGDTARGRVVLVRECVRCHGADGSGGTFANLSAPALWGARSFSVGASMARRERAASFIRQNMPYDKPGSLSDQDAFDVAALMTSMPRPDLPGKAQDWPLGGAPADVPYATKGHAAYLPPPVLPRRGDAAQALVPPPKRLTQR